MSISSTFVKLFSIWLFFCMSSTRKVFFIDIILIFLVKNFCWSSISSFLFYFKGILYSAGIVNCSIGLNHSGTWQIPVGHEPNSGFHQLPHSFFNNWIAQGAIWVPGWHSTGSCWDLHFGCLTQLARCQEFHRRLPTWNVSWVTVVTILLCPVVLIVP